MSLFALYCMPSGRIGRLTFWLAHLGLGIPYIALAIAYAMQLVAKARTGAFTDITETMERLKRHGDTASPQEIAELSRQMLTLLNPGFIVWVGLVLLAYAGFCVSAKRLHDRNKSAWWIGGYQAIACASFAANLMGAPIIAAATGLVAGIAGLWFFVELGFLPGRDGPNRFDGSGKPLSQFVADAMAEDYGPGFAVADTVSPRVAVAPAVPTASRTAPPPPVSRRGLPASPSRNAGFGRRNVRPA